MAARSRAEKDPRMTPAIQHEALLVFRGTWGRLFTIAAQSLNPDNGQPYHLDAVKLAAQGKGRSPDRTLREIRRARLICNIARDNAQHAGNTPSQMVAMWREAKSAVEGEWSVPLPLVSAQSSGR